MRKNNLTILSIKRSGKINNRFWLTLSSEEKIEVDDVAISSFHLFSGKQIAPRELQRIRSFAEVQRLKKYCFFILSKKMYSSGEIKTKLQKRSKDPGQIQYIIDELIRLKLLNDDEYARLYLRSLLNKKKYSRREIRQKFFRKGLPQKYLDSEEFIDLEYETITARELISKKNRRQNTLHSDPVNKQKLSAFLYRKGFNPDVISRVINEIEDA